MRALLLVAAAVAMLASPAGSAAPLPCVPAPADDPQPWVYNARVLASFPPAQPPPQFLGRFCDAASAHELHIWRDPGGIFGEWLSPVLDADSPTSRLYEPQFDVTSGALRVTARFPEGTQRFSGRIRGDAIHGTVERGGKTESIRLKRSSSPAADDPLRESVTSREQFECQMILFHRH